MNKQLIITYFEEFKHWLNGGKLLQKQINLVVPAEWEEFIEDWDWPIDELAVIIKDEYVEFRKALAEGKTIQIINKFNEEWMDLNMVAFSGPAEYYRIKPEEPKFKIGQWFNVNGTISYIESTTPNGNYKCKFAYKEGYWILEPNTWGDNYIQYMIEEPKFKVGDWIIVTAFENKTLIVKYEKHIIKENILVLNNNIYFPSGRFLGYIQHWQPQPGEWCWFHNGTVESLYFYKFHSIISEGYIADIPKDIEHIMTAQIFKYCEPFTGNLPTIIKDN